MFWAAVFFYCILMICSGPLLFLLYINDLFWAVVFLLYINDLFCAGVVSTVY